MLRDGGRTGTRRRSRSARSCFQRSGCRRGRALRARGGRQRRPLSQPGACSNAGPNAPPARIRVGDVAPVVGTRQHDVRSSVQDRFHDCDAWEIRSIGDPSGIGRVDSGPPVVARYPRSRGLCGAAELEAVRVGPEIRCCALGGGLWRIPVPANRGHVVSDDPDEAVECDPLILLADPFDPCGCRPPRAELADDVAVKRGMELRVVAASDHFSDNPSRCGVEVYPGPVAQFGAELVGEEVIACRREDQSWIVSAVEGGNVLGGPVDRPVACVRRPELFDGDASRECAPVVGGLKDAAGGVTHTGVRSNGHRCEKDVAPYLVSCGGPILVGSAREKGRIRGAARPFDDPLIVDHGKSLKQP